MAEIGERHGLPLWTYTASNDETLRLSFEYYADFHRLKDASIKSGYYSGETPRIGRAADSLKASRSARCSNPLTVLPMPMNSSVPLS